jgi:hypothetical protein
MRAKNFRPGEQECAWCQGGRDTYFPTLAALEEDDFTCFTRMWLNTSLNIQNIFFQARVIIQKLFFEVFDSDTELNLVREAMIGLLKITPKINICADLLKNTTVNIDIFGEFFSCLV